MPAILNSCGEQKFSLSITDSFGAETPANRIENLGEGKLEGK